MSKKIGRPATPFHRRFWSKVDVNSDPGRCWEWQGKRRHLDYGVFAFWDPERRKKGEKRAHRTSWELMYGEIPEGLFVCHHCDNPPCCNPYHLFLGTQADNMRDMHSKERAHLITPEERAVGYALKRARGTGKGEKNPRAKLTDEDIRRMRALRAHEGMTLKDLASEFGVHYSVIGRIVRGELWRNVEP